MTDYANALETAVYTRLAAQVTLGTVYQHLPEYERPSVVIISYLFPAQIGA